MFINKYLVPFKVTALRYNILMLAFFRSWKRQQLLFRFFFNLLNRSKTLSFIRCLQFWEEEKFSGGQVWWIRCLRHDYGFVFGQKLTLKHQCVSRCVNMMPNPWLVFPQFCAFLTNFFAELAHNFKVVFLIDRTTLWQEFMMHQAIAIKENSGQNLHIWPKLTYFFRSWLFRTLPLGLLGFGVNVVAIHSWFVTSYNVIICTILLFVWHYSLLFVRPCGKNPWCTTPLQSQKVVSKTFTFDQTWRAYFDLGSSYDSIGMIGLC